MRILDNYITRSIVKIFLSTIVLFTFLYMLIDAAGHLDDYIANQVAPAVIAQYYLAFLPVIFVQTSPIACLMAVLFTYSSLNNSNEIIALRASGLDFFKITRPALIFGLVVTALVFMVNETAVPGAASFSQELKTTRIAPLAAQKELRSTPAIKYLFFYGMDNRLFFIDLFEPATNTVKGLTVIGQDEKQRMTEKIVAHKGEWNGSAWKLTNCQITRYNPEDQTLIGEVPFYKEKIIDLKDSPQDFMRQRSRVSEMNIRDLKLYIKRFKGSGATQALTNLKVDLYQRIAYPFACIVIIFTGLPFTLVSGRRKGLTFASLGIAMLIGFLFFVINAVALAMGKEGLLPPAAAAGLTPVLFCAAGVYLIRKLF